MEFVRSVETLYVYFVARAVHGSKTSSLRTWPELRERAGFELLTGLH